MNNTYSSEYQNYVKRTKCKIKFQFLGFIIYYNIYNAYALCDSESELFKHVQSRLLVTYFIILFTFQRYHIITIIY